MCIRDSVDPCAEAAIRGDGGRAGGGGRLRPRRRRHEADEKVSPAMRSMRPGLLNEYGRVWDERSVTRIPPGGCRVRPQYTTVQRAGLPAGPSYTGDERDSHQGV